MDVEVVGRELLRALRGERSQIAWSRRLGYRSNVATTWERGRRWPTAAETLRAARRGGLDLDGALGRFYGRAVPWLADTDPASPEGVARLLEDLRGQTTVTDLAKRAGMTRSAVSRYLSGDTQPRLPEFLQLVEVASLRLVDLLVALVDPEALPSVAPLWRRLEARRAGAAQRPWTQAVLRALELADYRALPAHAEGWIARRLGLPLEEELSCLAFLEETGQIAWTGARWRPEVTTLDTRGRPEVGRQLKAHWSRVAADRVLAGDPGQFSYNVFTVSRADFERIRELHLAYFHALRGIVAASADDEVVAVANVQLFALG